MMFDLKKFIPKIKGTPKAKGSLIAAKNETKRTTLHLSSKTKDMLKSIIELPVYEDWLDDDVIEKIERDSTVTAAKGSRKAATLKKEVLITCEDDEVVKTFEDIFNFDTLDAILDIPYQGFGVFELNWFQKDIYGHWFPRLVERNYKNFTLENGELKFSADGMAQSILAIKAIHAVYKAKPHKPYGQPLYCPLFWLIEFKNASLEFWIDLLERFGTPWTIGKTSGDKDDFAEEIYNMLGGDGAVLDEDDELEIKTADKVGNFKEIIEYLDNQIREIILGGNLTGQVQSGSHAAATVHNNIREDLAQADENILNKIIKQTVEYFKKANPSFRLELKAELKDKDDPNKELADRDKVIYDMGYRPKKDYIEKTYNIEVEEVQEPKTQTPLDAKFAFSADKSYQDELHRQTDGIDIITPLTFQKQILEIIEASTSYEDMEEKLAKAYPDLDTKDLEELTYKAFANSAILAHAEVEQENPNG